MTHTGDMALSSTTASNTSSATPSLASSTTASPRSSTTSTPSSQPFSTALYQQTKARVKQLAEEDKSSRLLVHQQAIQQLQADHARTIADYEAKLAEERDKRTKQQRTAEKQQQKLIKDHQQQLAATTQQRQQKDDKYEQITKRRQLEIDDRTRTTTLAQYADEQHATRQQHAALTQRIQQLEDDVRVMAAEREEEKKRWRAEESRLQLQVTTGVKLVREWERKLKTEVKLHEESQYRIEQIQMQLEQQIIEQKQIEQQHNNTTTIHSSLQQQWTADKEALLNRLTSTTQQAEQTNTQLKQSQAERATEQRRWEEEKARWNAEREEELSLIEVRVKEVLEKKERAVMEAREECRQWRERLAVMEQEWQRHASELNGL